MPEATTPTITSAKSTTSSIHIRPALASDLPQISTLVTQIFSSTFGYSMPPADLAAYLADSLSVSSLRADFHDPAVTILVATPAPPPSSTTIDLKSTLTPTTTTTTILGFAQLRRNSTDPCLAALPSLLELQRLYVGAAHQGLGVGGALTREVERRARAEGAGNLWLGVWEENVKAQRVYERMGFVRVGAHDFTMGTCVQRDWVLVKGL